MGHVSAQLVLNNLDDVKRVSIDELSDTEATTLVINNKHIQDEEYASTSEVLVSAKKILKKHLQAFKELAK